MSTEEMQDLIKRINEEPSVLFLGQNYLANDPGNRYIHDLKENLGIEDEEIHDFPSLYCKIEQSCENPEDSLKSIQKLSSAMCSISTSYSRVTWLKKLLHWRWNLVYTSTTDGIIFQNYSADRINDPTASYRTEFAQKSHPHLIELFGNCSENADSDLSIPLSSKDVRRCNRTRFDYIRNQIINQYGILLIVGWGPSDWFKADYFIDTFLALNPKSVYVFGITPDDLLKSVKDEDEREDLKQLLDNECIYVDKRTFINALQEDGCWEDPNELDEDGLLNAYSCYSLTFHNQQCIQIPKKDLLTLDNKIQLIHDDLIPLVNTDDVNTEIAFTSFLTQGAEVKWSLFSDRYAFCFKRDIDEELLADIKKQMKRSSNKRKPIILEGVSSSGKTTTLIHLALHLKQRLHKPAAVFYISGEPEEKEWIDTLHSLIRNRILNKQFRDNQYLNEVILVCDMNIHDYTELQNAFAECNALIIGSSYLRHDPSEEHVFLLEPTLSKEENKQLKRVLERVNPKRCREFFDILEYQRQKNDQTPACIFELLANYARFIGDRTWREVTMNHQSRLAKESRYTEYETGKAFFETRDFFLENGIGAALVEKIHTDFGEDSQYEIYVEQIRKINKYVAIAGQFGEYLPFSLLLKMLGRNNQSSDYQIRVRFIKEVLSLDSLLEFKVDQIIGWITVRFRNPKEAYQYLCYQQANPDERKKLEIDLLCELILECDWNENYGDEARKMISLIRSYGPNSHGRPFEDHRKNSYLTEYVDHWHKIVEALEKKAVDKNPEAMLIYCHLLREEADKMMKRDDEEDIIPEVESANKRLSGCILKWQESINNDYQMARLEGEMCANLNFLMKYTDYQVKPDLFDLDFGEFQKHFISTIRYFLKSRKEYSFSNLYLDIWLNAVQHYRDVKHVLKDSATNETKQDYRELMSKSLEYIERFFVPSSKETNVSHLLSKIKEVFDYFKSDQLHKIEQQLDLGHNDSMMFMKMMEPFICNITDDNEELKCDDAQQHQITVFLNELGGKYISARNLYTYKEAAKPAAEKTVCLFEENGFEAKAKKYKSARCFYLYLKAKWLLITGNLLLEEKQKPALTPEQWQDIKKICDAYLGCFDSPYTDSMVKPAVLLLYAAYNWMFSIIDYKEHIALPFNSCSALMRSDSVEARIGFCNEKGKLYGFAADIDVEGRPIATVRKENCRDRDNCLLPSTRKGLYISELTCNLIFNGHRPRRLTANERPIVNIWFNGKGAQISLASEAGEEETE